MPGALLLEGRGSGRVRAGGDSGSRGRTLYSSRVYTGAGVETRSVDEIIQETGPWGNQHLRVVTGKEVDRGLK